MAQTPSPYNIIGIVSFGQGFLTLIAALAGALWSLTDQARANRRLRDNLNGKIDEITRKHSHPYSGPNSGTTRDLLERLQYLREDLLPWNL